MRKGEESRDKNAGKGGQENTIHRRNHQEHTMGIATAAKSGATRQSTAEEEG